MFNDAILSLVFVLSNSIHTKSMYVTLGERCEATPFTRLAFHVQILKLLTFLDLKQVWWQVYIHLMGFLVVEMSEFY